MKNLRLITLAALILVVAIGLQVQATPYTYVATGVSTSSKWSPHINASGDVAFNNGSGPGGTAGIYDFSSGTVTDLGNPASPWGNEMEVRGITDGGRIVSQTNYATGYSWYYDPVVGWVRSWNTYDSAEACSQTRVLVRPGNNFWYADLDDVFANAGDHRGDGVLTINPADRVGAGAMSGFSYAADINNNGEAVGNTGTPEGYLYDPVGDSWSALPSPELRERLCLNDSGLIAGSNGLGDGYVYDGVNPPVLIGTGLTPTAINNSGVVVGRMGSGAFIWDSANGLRDLNSAGVVSGIPGGTVIATPSDIADNGWITGQANTGELFILTPEPATLAVLALGGLLLGLRRRS